jgi:hypothetical protein
MDGEWWWLICHVTSKKVVVSAVSSVYMLLDASSSRLRAMSIYIYGHVSTEIHE